MPEIIPVHDNVLIKPDEYRSPGGIVIPDSVELDPEKQSRTGTVLAVGTGPLMDNATSGFGPMECRPGERVEYLTAYAKPVDVGGKRHDVVRDRYVLWRYGD
jgi:co-chaperonin GroES (HSP10)